MTELDEFLAHYGVKGMRWGVRRSLKKMAPADREAYLKQKDAKWRAKVEADPKLGKISAKASRIAKKETKKLNRDYKDRGINLKKDAIQRNRYDMELKSVLERSLDTASYKVHKYPPSRLFEVQIHRHPDGSITSMIGQRHNAKLVKQQGKIAKYDRRQAKKAVRVAKKEGAAISHAAPEVVGLPGTLEDYGDFEDMQFYLPIDEEGYVTDVSSPSDVLEQMDAVDEFLAHYGVKGMRWGVRRSDKALSRAAGGRKSSKKSGSDDGEDDTIADKARSAVGLKTTSEKLAEKGKDAFVSVDAERTIKTSLKEGHEMSDREIREAINRAKMVKEYDDLFNKGPNSALAAKVEALKLEKEYRQYQAELNPKKGFRNPVTMKNAKNIADLVDNAATAYESFAKLNDATGGVLATKIKLPVRSPKSK